MEIQKTEAEIPVQASQDIALTALHPNEMMQAQQQLISWCEQKVATIRLEAKELNEAYEHAARLKWKSTTLKTQWARTIKRVHFYEKMKAALEAGYHIVPNFPVQMFAIRKPGRGRPRKAFSKSTWETFTQKASEMPLGEGEYQNPFPIVWKNEKTLADGNVDVRYFPKEWDDFEFPITMAKPLIMQATSHAMGLKIFDRIGVMPAAKKEDPVILGQIFTGTKTVSFMIAWHLDTRVL